MGQEELDQIGTKTRGTHETSSSGRIWDDQE